MSEEVFYTDDEGKEYFNEEQGLAILLAEDVCFVSGQDYIASWDPKEKTVGVVVNCNDLFYWASGDAQGLPNSQIESLYRAWKDGGKWGVDKWCCKQRGLRPQVPIVTDMKKDGAWDETMEALPAPEPS